MLKTKKKAITLVVILILLFSLASQSLAAGYVTKDIVSGVITPQWVNTDQVSVNLSFSGSKAICGAYVIGKVETSQITGTVALERLNSTGTYTTVKTWSGLSAYGSYLDFNGTYYVSTGYTYRLTFTITVYRNGTSEKITASSSAYAG